MRISDWSSDVCSSDLRKDDKEGHRAGAAVHPGHGGNQQAATKEHQQHSGRHDIAPKEERQQRQHAKGKLPARSEEHTSALQSLMRISYAVFCLNKTRQSRTKTPTISWPRATDSRPTTTE